MLRLLLGKAGAGKTGTVINEIKRAVEQKDGGRLYIVPEQYSHEAERELCRDCGDSLSQYAMVFSFTGLARYLRNRMGGSDLPALDKGGRLLCMALALKNVGARLKVYGAARHKAELQSMLLAAVDELKTAVISPDRLLITAGELNDALGDKLSDLALIAESYDAVVANGHVDPADALTELARQIADSGYGKGLHIYVDGFIDFTRQESLVLAALLDNGAELQVCLTVDALEGDNEIYELSRRAARSLIRDCGQMGVDYEVQTLDAPGEKADALRFFADNMFSYAAERYTGEAGALSLYRAESVAAECELAAATAISLVRDKGCRWRDISVAVRGFEDYRGTLESVFRAYSVPLYTARRGALLQKPLPAMIAAAYETLWGGWDVDDVTGYMRTGLAGLDSEECDELESYIFKWQLRSAAWQRKGDWRQHPEGYGREYDQETEERLGRINALRRRLAEPLLSFMARAEEAHTAAEQAMALSAFFQELCLPETLERRADQLRESGREALAEEYRQLWELTVSALEQCAAILGDSPMEAEDFGRLFTLMLSKYDVGTIPVSLDSVSAGDFDRNRRRHIKHLIVLGASDQRLPLAEESPGVFSQEERERLKTRDIDLGGGEAELWREFTLIYSTLTLPSDSLTLCCPTAGSDGEELRPSFIFNRAAAVFGLEAAAVMLRELRTAAPGPALSLAAMGLRQGGGSAALEYFRRRQPERCAALERAATMTRGRLSPMAVEQLYGKRLRLSASRIDKFASCRFAYFCQYGLRAKPYEPLGFTPPEIGSFMHFVLERTARAVTAKGGFKAVEDEELLELCDGFVAEYVSVELNDFQEKSKRFIYLFQRVCRDLRRIVTDMAAELRRSDFVPLDFELDFAGAQELPPIELGDGEDALTLTGIADRVDGWVHGDKLYLRVVDYKTGKKKFSLSDVWYGMGLQMLLYLFALEAGGKVRYGREIVPAGVMYVPARDAMLSMDSAPKDGEPESKRAEQLRRSGLVLDDSELIEAWEKGEDKRYIPVKYRSGKPTGDAVANLERLGLMRKHIDRALTQMAGQLRRGSIAADPFYRSQQENACLNCDYLDACHFSHGQNGEKNRFAPSLSPQRVWELIEGGDSHE